MTSARVLAAALATAAVGLAQGRGGLSSDHQAELAKIQPAINQAIDDGVRWLLGSQQRDGSWSFEEEVFATGQTALSTYTLLKCGIPREHAAIQRAIAHFTTIRPTMVYAAGAQVLALTATHDKSYHGRVREIVDDIAGWQEDSWSYPNPGGKIQRLHSSRDLSITQFALLAYRAAAAEGLPIATRSLRDAFDGTLRFQDSGSSAGFSYR
ncbi:MAG: hypothetical protein KDB80_06695 [Planctomycetes bacterium]|nr:hypothetical protein [Planctomycetota bacterium]